MIGPPTRNFSRRPTTTKQKGHIMAKAKAKKPAKKAAKKKVGKKK